MCISSIYDDRDDPQCNEQLEDNEEFCQIETLEEENSNAISWTEWTAAKLSSKKSKELQLSNNNENEDLLTLEDIETVVASSKENFNSAVNNDSSRPYLKRKKSKQLQVNPAKRNEQYDLTQSKMELVEVLKENTYKKTALEISILEMQLEKERLYVEVLKKQLHSD